MIFSILLSILLLISCSEFNYEYVDVGSMEDYSFEHDLDLHSALEVERWVYYNITYTSDNGEYWNTPEETYLSRVGDCEDIALLKAYLYREIGIHYDLIVLEHLTNGKFHVILDSEIVSYDHEEWGYRIKIPYGEAMWMTYYFHENVGKYYNF